MNGFRAKVFLILCSLAAAALPALAQNSTEILPPPDRAASFIAPGSDADAAPTAGFSGLAAAPELVAPPTPAPTVPLPAGDKPPDIIAGPVAVAPLPDVSNESVGTQGAQGLGATMWKGTPRAAVDILLPLASVTQSPVLNDLMLRLLITAAVPPEAATTGAVAAAPSLTAQRVEKLIAFGDVGDAWALAKNADAALIDDITEHLVIDHLLAAGGDEVCALLPDLAKTRPTVDWQKDLVICQLRAKDSKAAQVSLDIMRAQAVHDSIFIDIADKTILGTEKTLPTQLTPLTPSLLAMLRLSGLALPGDIYGHPDMALAGALLHAPAQQDVAQLGLGERAAARGIITADDLAAIYRATNFAADALANPLTASESGSRQRALLFRAAEAEKDTGRRIADTVKFIQVAPPELLNGAGSIAAIMLGDVKPDAAYANDAVTLAQVDMLAGHGDVALAWMRLAQPTAANAQNSQNLWPQFVLAGLESDSAYAADLGNWLDTALRPGNPPTDSGKARDNAAATLLLLDAAGFTVLDDDWAKVLAASATAKHVALSPLLFDRLHAAATAGRKAESVLLAVDLAGDGDISLPVALSITRALRSAGFKAESAIFARHQVALLAKAE